MQCVLTLCAHNNMLAGLRVLVFVTNTAVCKMALQLARSFLKGKCTEITLAHCAPNMYSYEGMQGVLGALAEGLSGFRVNCEVGLWGIAQQSFDSCKHLRRPV